eukprot:TRINITY_DN10788_c0_g1_i1.p1 TRINITY_DN10788_c0_g1~~TRINITY_DN10788_c0_g1_i1.p1  ORF type:complete len:124 (+),score=44.76 TRINITY_DN10788_c0_g1_i1:81-452(+)
MEASSQGEVKNPLSVSLLSEESLEDEPNPSPSPPFEIKSSVGRSNGRNPSENPDANIPKGNLIEADQSRLEVLEQLTPTELTEKMAQVEDWAKRLSEEEESELNKGRILNILGTRDLEQDMAQ